MTVCKLLIFSSLTFLQSNGPVESAPLGPKINAEAYLAQHYFSTNDRLFVGTSLPILNASGASVTSAQQRLPRNDASLLLADMLVLC